MNYDIPVPMARGVKDRPLVPGRLFRDLDGSLVHLLSVDRDLCSWFSVTDFEKNRQVTHRENFRRRFRCLDDAEFDTKAAA